MERFKRYLIQTNAKKKKKECIKKSNKKKKQQNPSTKLTTF